MLNSTAESGIFRSKIFFTCKINFPPRNLIIPLRYFPDFAVELRILGISHFSFPKYKLFGAIFNKKFNIFNPSLNYAAPRLIRPPLEKLLKTCGDTEI